MFRRRFLATIVSTVAPQMPCWAPRPPGITRHGPMKQLRQQTPNFPNLHWGCWLAKRSQAVAIPACPATSIMASVAGSLERTFCSLMASPS